MFDRKGRRSRLKVRSEPRPQGEVPRWRDRSFLDYTFSFAGARRKFSV